MDANMKTRLIHTAQGVVGGAAVLAIVAFAAGWVVTSGSRDADVESARVETLAYICSQDVRAVLVAQNIEEKSLKGFGNRDERTSLVESSLESLNIPKSLMRRVTTECGRPFA